MSSPETPRADPFAGSIRVPPSRPSPGGTTRDVAREREAILIDILQTGLDLRATAVDAQAPMLVYLVDLLIHRAREELEAIDESGDRESGDRESGDHEPGNHEAGEG